MASRRGFFKELLREVAGVAQELSSAAQPVEEPEPWRPAPPVPARPATAALDHDALLALCRDVGLEHRVEDLRRAARTSVRLTRGDGSGRSRLGGSPEVPAGFAWPMRNDRALDFLGQVDLQEVAALDPESPLPRAGLLLCFYDLAALPTGLRASDRAGCRVLLVGGELEPDEQHEPALHPLPLELSRELMVPSAWSFHAEQLELSADELDAWETLRERLAQAQGLELEESVPDRLALHRLLGYQDEIGREVELDCELASAGLDADDTSVYWESRSDHEGAAREWRLLFQLSADDDLGTPRDDFARLFVCVREAELRRGDLDGAWAVLR